MSGLAELEAQIPKLEASAAGYDAMLVQVDAAIAYMEALKARPFEERPTPVAAAESLKRSLAKVKENEKTIHQSLSRISKAVNSSLPFYYTEPEHVSFSSPESARLMDTAIALHLLRRGHVDVVKTLLEENKNLSGLALQIQEFDQMQRILLALDGGDLSPALEWARQHRSFLSRHGSDLHFALHKLSFVKMLPGSSRGTSESNDPTSSDFDPKLLISYARTHFAELGSQYLNEICSLALRLASARSDYKPLPTIDFEGLLADTRQQFVWDYCSWLGLAPESPLLLAAYAGTLAVPVLQKMGTLMKSRSAEWTTENELPVPIDLPPSLQFHPIFVCPVAKEQTTNDSNPPYLLPCGHILSDTAIKSLALSNVSKRTFKCPYCPQTAAFDSLQRVFF